MELAPELRRTTRGLVAMVVLVGATAAQGQVQRLPTVMRQQVELIQQIADTLHQQVRQMGAARAKVASGQSVELPNVLAEVTPLARQLSRAVKDAETIMATARTAAQAVPVETQQQILARSQEIMAAGVAFQAAYDALNGECEVWMLQEDWPRRVTRCLSHLPDATNCGDQRDGAAGARRQSRIST